MEHLCTKCGLEKEVNEENFCRDKSRKSGFGNYCKPCARLMGREYHAKACHFDADELIDYDTGPLSDFDLAAIHERRLRHRGLTSMEREV